MGALSNATVYVRADGYSGTGDLIDVTGNGHDAQFGSTGGADTNDPLFLARHSGGGKYAQGTATASNNITATAAVDVDGEEQFDFRFEASRDESGLTARIFDESNGVLYISQKADGTLVMRTNDTTGVVDMTSSVAVPYALGEWYQGRAVWDATGVGNATVTFYTREIGTPLDNDSGWTALGAVQNAGRDMSAQNLTTTSARIFSTGAAGVLGGVQRVLCMYGASNLTWFDCDLNDATEPYASFSSGGVTWTINRSATGVKLAIVDRDMLLLGTDDFLEIADHADLDFGASDDFTAAFWGRMYDAAPASPMMLVAKRGGTAAANIGWLLEMTATSLFGEIGDGSAEGGDSQSNPSDGTSFVGVVRRDTTADEIEVALNGALSGSPGTDATTATLENGFAVGIGAELAGAEGSFLDGEFFAMALWRRALTDAEIAGLGEEFAGGTSRSRRRYNLQSRRVA